METIKKIVIIGPESTGKSTLCRQLAEHYKTFWVPEYAREYLLTNGKDYTYEDLLTIAKGQLDLEKKIVHQLSGISYQAPVSSSEEATIRMQSSNDISHKLSLIPDTLFIDTDMYVMKVWCEFVFNKCHNWILNRIAERRYDGYLLCSADVDWVQDALREYPDKKTRDKLYYYYRDLMVNQTVPWADIHGDYTTRFSKAIDFIETKIR